MAKGERETARIFVYNMSKKSCILLYSELVYDNGQDFANGDNYTILEPQFSDLPVIRAQFSGIVLT